MLRIGGLASGIDTDTMIVQMMAAHRMPVDRLIQQRTTLEWQRDAYREMNTKMTDYRNNKLSDFRLQGTFLHNKVTITGDSSAISARAIGDVQSSSLTVTVHELATAAAKWSHSSIRNGENDIDASDVLLNQSSNLSSGQFPDEEYEYSFKINGNEVKVNVAEDSLNTIISRINTITNVTAFYDHHLGKISFMAKETGAVNGANGGQTFIEFEDGDGFLQDVFKINVDDNTPGDDSTEARNADVTINGMRTSRESNVFMVNGIEVTLLQATSHEASIQIARDTDQIFDAVVRFVNEYNEMLESINQKINEDRDRGYHPLTEQQRKDMSDKDVELWEETAKKGMLRNDSILTSIADKMRMIVSSNVEVEEGKFLSLASLGITTGSYTERGKLHIDEFLLKEAINADPDGVKELFTKRADDDTPIGSSVTSVQGIGVVLYEEFRLSISQISEKAGSPLSLVNTSFLGKDIERINERIEDANRRMQMIEDRYYRQFSAMEAAIQRLNMQADSLLGMFGGGQY